MPLLRQTIWGHIWKNTSRKSQTNATSVSLAALIQVLWGLIWNYTVEESQTNATSAQCVHWTVFFLSTESGGTHCPTSRLSYHWTHLKIHTGEKSNKCNQCEFGCYDPSSLRSHMKLHSGEESNKCNQCNYVSSQAVHLRTHLTTHIGEKSNKCKQCDFVSSQAGHLMRHLATHTGEKTQKCTNVTLHPLMQALWKHIWKYTLEKSRTKATSASLTAPIQALWGLTVTHILSHFRRLAWIRKPIRHNFTNIMSANIDPPPYIHHIFVVIWTGINSFITFW